MKRLTLMRHAKSDWNNPELSDFDRPLNKRGLRDAPAMGERYAARIGVPDHIHASTAVRALTTAELFATKIGYDSSKIIFHQELYLASAGILLSVVNQLEDSDEHVVLIGHNPGITELAIQLSNQRLDNLPTAGIWSMLLDEEHWAAVSAGSGSLHCFDFPKRYSAE